MLEKLLSLLSLPSHKAKVNRRDFLKIVGLTALLGEGCAHAPCRDSPICDTRNLDPFSTSTRSIRLGDDCLDIVDYRDFSNHVKLNGSVPVPTWLDSVLESHYILLENNSKSRRIYFEDKNSFRRKIENVVQELGKKPQELYQNNIEDTIVLIADIISKKLDYDMDLLNSSQRINQHKGDNGHYGVRPVGFNDLRESQIKPEDYDQRIVDNADNASVDELFNNSNTICRHYSKVFAGIWQVVQERNKNIENINCYRFSSNFLQHGWNIIVAQTENGRLISTMVDPTWYDTRKEEADNSGTRSREDSLDVLSAVDDTHLNDFVMGSFYFTNLRTFDLIHTDTLPGIDFTKAIALSTSGERYYRQHYLSAYENLELSDKERLIAGLGLLSSIRPGDEIYAKRIIEDFPELINDSLRESLEFHYFKKSHDKNDDLRDKLLDNINPYSKHIQLGILEKAGYSFFSEGDYQSTIECYEKALNIDSDYPTISIPYGNSDIFHHRRSSTVSVRFNALEGKIPPMSYLISSPSLNELAYSYTKVNDLDNSLKVYRTMLKVTFLSGSNMPSAPGREFTDNLKVAIRTNSFVKDPELLIPKEMF
jgi:tetratricopeptide (TPR) repeat protein